LLTGREKVRELSAVQALEKVTRPKHTFGMIDSVENQHFGTHDERINRVECTSDRCISSFDMMISQNTYYGGLDVAFFSKLPHIRKLFRGWLISFV
jgi:hypothetical protein